MVAPFDTAKGFCTYVEGLLGWSPTKPNANPVTRAKAFNREVGLVKAKIATRPDLYTWENLQLAADWCRKHYKALRPSSVLFKVEAAIEEFCVRQPPRQTDLTIAVEAAIAHEQGTQREGWQDWIGQLVRSRGAGREAVYQEWLIERGP